MKTSNKILLGLLLCSFGYLTFAQLALHVKYTNNDYISPQQYNEHFYDERILENIKHISINSIALCEILPSTAVKLSVEKGKMAYAKFNVSGDTLVITGQYPGAPTANYILNTSPQNIRLYIPPGIPVNAKSSNLDILGTRKAAGAGSFYFQLDNANLFTRFRYYNDSVNRYFGNFIVHATNESQVILYHNDYFDSINVQLTHSLINDNQAKIKQLAVQPDSNSTVIISGRNIQKLNPGAIK